MRTELIEKLQKVILINAGDSRLHLGLMKQPPLVDCRVIAEDLYQEIIQALSETKGVSAEEVLKKYSIEYGFESFMELAEFGNDKVIQEATIRAMHDYAGQSDAKEKAILFAKFCVGKNINYTSSENDYNNAYQQFLNREEGKK